jgi:hypothetical protein
MKRYDIARAFVRRHFRLAELSDKTDRTQAMGHESVELMMIARHDFTAQPARQGQTIAIGQRDAYMGGFQTSGILPEGFIHILSSCDSGSNQNSQSALGCMYITHSNDVIVDFTQVRRVRAAFSRIVAERLPNNLRASFHAEKGNQGAGIEDGYHVRPFS